MQVVDAAPRNTTQCGEGLGVGVEQHFVPLTGVGHQPECPTGAQFQVRDLHANGRCRPPPKPSFAAVKLEGFAQIELQWNKGVGRLAFASSPLADECGELAVTTQRTVGFDLPEQGLDRAPVLLGAVGIGLERLLGRLMKRREFARSITSRVGWLRRLDLFGFPEPLPDRVAR